MAEQLASSNSSLKVSDRIALSKIHRLAKTRFEFFFLSKKYPAATDSKQWKSSKKPNLTDKRLWDPLEDDGDAMPIHPPLGRDKL